MVFSDPLAANLVLLGTVYIGIAAYVVFRYILGRENDEVSRSYGSFLTLTGAYATLYGLFYSILWPGPMTGAYNILFGDSLTLFGFLSLLSGWAILKKSNLYFVGIMAFFVGIYAIVSGVGAYNLSMTRAPLVMLSLYLASGVSGLLVPVTIITKNKVVSILLVITLVVAALSAFAIGFPAVPGHLAAFTKVA
ncbi:MAG: DUF981 domain-containing protein [Candidatus Thermoplasmatota archaeon]|nr:DUF981 domain-containing protein [Candidatus Thermoplasmatota archaeon]